MTDSSILLFRREMLIKQASGRPRLNFKALSEFSPELSERCLIIRGRVKDLRTKFLEDADWALDKFNRFTTGALQLGGGGVLVAFLIGLFVPGSATAASVILAVAAIAGLITAGTKAFGWHGRYRAMFHAAWEMAALETMIDQELYDIAIGLPDNGELSDSDRQRLAEAKNTWITAFQSALQSFGETYGAALSPVEIRELLRQK